MTTPTSAPRAGYQLRVGAPDALPVSVALTPQQSVIGLMHQAASGQSLGAPASLLAAIRAALRPQARFAARPFAARGPTLIPECSAPISPLAAASVAEQAGRLREMPAEKLTGLLQTGYDGGGFPPCWEAAGDEPRRWLSSMADASLDTWTVIEPRWRAAGRLFDRELRRVGIAAVRGGMAALLNSLHPRISYADGMLTVAHPGHRCVTLGRRRLVLMPMIAGRDSVLASFERPGVCCIGYPVRQPSPGAPVTSGGALALILGQLRDALRPGPVAGRPDTSQWRADIAAWAREWERHTAPGRSSHARPLRPERVLAELRLDARAVAGTVADFNAAVKPGGTFAPAVLDDCATAGISPPKSHWAQPIDTPPFYGVPMRPGITFTYKGVAVTEQARVRRTDGTTFANVFAAGEIMSGNVLSTGYLAGFGLTIGSVWGRIAGGQAARDADDQIGRAQTPSFRAELGRLFVGAWDYVLLVAIRDRLCPAPEQEQVLRMHRDHARYVWNLAVEQQTWWWPGRGRAPGYVDQARQLAEARAAEPWLRGGSSSVQQQALRDFDLAMTAFFDPLNPAGRPGYRSKRHVRGFAIRDTKVRRLNGRWGEVHVPKCGWVRFRWTRPLPTGLGMARVTCDRAGRWHVSFPAPQPAVAATGQGGRTGIDRGVRTALVTSRPATSPAWPTSATTAAPASTPACTRRRTSSGSTRRRSCPGCGRPRTSPTRPRRPGPPGSAAGAPRSPRRPPSGRRWWRSSP